MLLIITTVQDGKTLQLTIGYHQLEGKRVPLKKPMAILSKRVESASESVSTSYEVCLVSRRCPRCLLSNEASVSDTSRSPCVANIAPS